MLTDRIEAPRLKAFEAVLPLCRAAPGMPVCLLGESRSRALNLDLAEALAIYGQRDTDGTGLRASAGRFTAGHVGIPMRGCTIILDGDPVVVAGRLA